MTRKRQCGGCTLCCKLLPVPEFAKPANTRCAHQCAAGCRIYKDRPLSCAFWNCRWLAGDETGQRPDRAHYVVDMMLDYVEIRNTATDELQHQIPVLQVWVEPGYTEAVMRDRALLSFIEAERTAALLREANKSGVFIAPPSLTGTAGEYHIQRSRFMTHEHSFAEIAAVVGDAPITVVVPQDRRPKSG